MLNHPAVRRPFAGPQPFRIGVRCFASPRAVAVLFLVASGTIFSSAAVGEDTWPQWRGPQGNGVAATTLPVRWNESENVLWKCALPAWGNSTPAVWNDALFLTVQHDDGKLQLLRIRAADGTIVWIRDVGAAETPRESEKRSTQKFHRLHNAASPSPVTDGDLVFVHFGNGDLAAFDFDGNQRWKRNLQDDYGPYSIWWGHANSPVVYADTVISVCMQDSLDGATSAAAVKQAVSYVVAHDKRTGEVRWFVPRATAAPAEQADAYTTPVFHRAADGDEMIIMGGNELDAYDPATGRRRWHLSGLFGGRTVTGPIVDGDTVFATRGQKGELTAVRLGGSGPLAESDVVFRHGDATPDTCSPVVWDGRIYTIADQGIAQSLDTATGKQLWKQRMPGDYKASLLAAAGRVYFLNTAGLCTVVDATTPEFKVLSENQIDDETLASPAAADGKLYLRGRSKLYCIGSAK